MVAALKITEKFILKLFQNFLIQFSYNFEAVRPTSFILIAFIMLFYWVYIYTCFMVAALKIIEKFIFKNILEFSDLIFF